MSVSVLVNKSTRACGEGPYWQQSKKSLLYVDLHVGDVHVYDSATHTDTKTHFGEVEPCLF